MDKLHNHFAFCMANFLDNIQEQIFFGTDSIRVKWEDEVKVAFLQCTSYVHVRLFTEKLSFWL